MSALRICEVKTDIAFTNVRYTQSLSQILRTIHAERPARGYCDIATTDTITRTELFSQRILKVVSLEASQMAAELRLKPTDWPSDFGAIIVCTTILVSGKESRSFSATKALTRLQLSSV